MNRKRLGILAASGAAVAIVAGVGIGTFANFFDVKENDANVAAKKLYFGQELDVFKATLGDVQPGNVVLKNTFTLSNSGDMAGTISLKFTAKGTGDGVCTPPEALAEKAVDKTCAKLGQLPSHLRVTLIDTATGKPVADAVTPAADSSCSTVSADCYTYSLLPEGTKLAAAGTPTGSSVEYEVIVSVYQVDNTGTSDSDNVIQGDTAELAFTAKLLQ